MFPGTLNFFFFFFFLGGGGRYVFRLLTDTLKISHSQILGKKDIFLTKLDFDAPLNKKEYTQYAVSSAIPPFFLTKENPKIKNIIFLHINTFVHWKVSKTMI